MALLFVYGSLRRGSGNPHAHALERDAQWLGPAVVKAETRVIGSYPGLKLGGNDVVRGEVWDVPDAMLPALDEYEGEEYRRAVAQVTLDEGATVECWIYEYLPDWP